MTGGEVMSFILPQMDDPIQITFLLIILVLMIGTMVSAHLTARTVSWEKKWNRGTPDDSSDDLDIEHGSVTDLWHAVATAPEKIAEIMPGMLLVIGLLGTFLGLGLALNKASAILGQAEAMSAGAAADSMSHLMGLLQGLGTKFKTSTWGITGFVLLKIWSEGTRFEEKRLTWVISKVKTELEGRKRQEIAEEAKKREALHAEISAVATHVVAGLAEQVGKMLVLEKGQHQQLIQRFDNLNKGQGELLVELRANRDAMAQFSAGMLNVVENMATGAQRMVEGADRIGAAADRMAQGADKVGEAANGLVGAVDEFQTQFTDVLNDVRNDLGAAIKDMSAQAAVTLEKGSTQLSDATREISAALGVLSADVKNTMNEVKDSIGDALKIQRRASEEFTLSSRALNENIEATTGIVGKLARPIEDGLRAVSDSGQHMRSVGRSLDGSLGAMQRVVESLEPLSEALKPLASSHEYQQELISALSPLHQLQDKQQELIKELRGLRSDLITPPVPKTENLAEA
jgi:methyl-accepting chemotaxis protein